MFFFLLSVFQKKEWLCLNCQTQRLLSGGGLDEPPLPVPHPSPKHLPMGSPRHQVPANQQSPLHKATNQQGPRPAQPQTQKAQTGSGVSGLFAPAASKQLTDTKTTTPVSTTETQKALKPTEEKPKPEPENQTDKDTKTCQKKGEPITPIKEMKKSRHYDVSLIPFFLTLLQPGVQLCMLSYGKLTKVD